MQEVAEHLFAVRRIFQGVEDVVMPEGIDVHQRRRFFLRKLFHQDQETPVFEFHRIGLFQAPSFA